MEGKNSIWALPLGGVMVAIQYFVGPLVAPGAFGLSRWMSGFVDIVSLPVLIPLIVCAALVTLKKFSATVDYAGFTLVWLIPLAAFRSMSENLPSLLPLIIIPLLWIAQALSIPLFIGFILKKPRWYIIVPSVFCIIALPIIATTSWWAFFINRLSLGFIFLGTSLIPALISMIISERKIVVIDQCVVDSEKEEDSSDQ
jgi:hypothetical protein